MKIFVCLKHVPDTAINIKVSGTNGYDDSDVKFIPNPYDEYAVEEAIRIVEEQGGEVVIITVGKPEAAATIRGAMAMGADRAILVKTDRQFLDSSLTAEALKAAIEADGMPDMIFTGKGSVDTEGFQTQYRLARALDMPVVNDVSVLTLENDAVQVQRETGNGEKQVIRMTLPCLVGATKGLNEPRYPKFQAIMKAKKKEIKEMDIADFGIDPSNGRVTIEKLTIVPERSNARMLDGSVDDQVTELIRVLKEDEKVL